MKSKITEQWKAFQGVVDIEKCYYDRHYLLLVRNILKETKQLSCPEKEPELKELGIDIASAPAAGSIGVSQVCLF